MSIFVPLFLVMQISIFISIIIGLGSILEQMSLVDY